MDKINTDNLSKLIQAYRPNLKENSLKQYAFHLTKLKSLFEDNNFNFLNNPDKVMDKIKNNAYTSKRNTLNSIIIILRAVEEKDTLIDQYVTKRDEFNEQYADEQVNGVISDKQKDNFISVDEFTNMLKQMDCDIKHNKLKKKGADKLSSTERELLMVYTMFSILIEYPTRNDMAGMKYINKAMYNKLTEQDKKDNNYIVTERSSLMMVLNQYKTSAKYGEKKIPISKPVEKIIRMYIRSTGINVGDTLFVKRDGEPLSRNGVSKVLIKMSQKYIKKNISTTMIRKIVVSHKFSKLKQEQNDMAYVMCHDVNTQNAVYVKSTN
jgi:hypothetical protein